MPYIDPQTAPQPAAAAALNTTSLQQKILGILGSTLLNSPAATLPQQTTAAPPALALANLAQQFGINISQAAQPPPQVAATVTSKNFQMTDPNIKKTLDSLLTNSNLLKSLVPQASSLQNAQKFTATPPQGPMGGGGGGGPQPQSLLGPGGGGPPPNMPQVPQGNRQSMMNPNFFGGPPMPEGGGGGMGPRGGQFHAPFGSK